MSDFPAIRQEQLHAFAVAFEPLSIVAGKSELRMVKAFVAIAAAIDAERGPTIGRKRRRRRTRGRERAQVQAFRRFIDGR